MVLNNQELFNSVSHALGFIAALVGGVFLLINAAKNLTLFLIAIIYSLSMMAMFSASSLYHFFKKEENGNMISRKLDHFAIYFFIAGSYTAISYLYFSRAFYIPLIIAQWSIVLIGVIVKSKSITTNKSLDVAIYLAMGWMAIIAIVPIIKNMSLTMILYLFLGGVAYSIGAIMRNTEKPILIRGVIEGHELFHVFIIIGASLHYLVIFFGIKSTI
ncbi:MAG: PAQR family membrane homeostasis protein TrhA [Candidatus Heimdallarchaeaceae archaeon]